MTETTESRKNKAVRAAVSAVLLTVLILAALAGAAKLTERKESRIKNGAFFETAGRIDVLLLGSSHVINGIDPVQLY